MAFETLFTPLQLGSLSIPNRVVMAPLTRARTPDSVPDEIQEAYYGQRAGAGLIITEATPKVAVLLCNCGTLGEFLTKWFNLTANSR